MNEWRNDQWSDALESLDNVDQSLWKLTRRVMRVPDPFASLAVPGDWRYLIPRKQRPWPTALRLSFNR
jgi:hypothetical protein